MTGSRKLKVPAVITIDGPAGSGKSTVSALLAKTLGLNFLSTGGFYRGLALLCQVTQVDTSSEGKVIRLLEAGKLKVTCDWNGTKIFIEKDDVTESLHTESVAKIASQISAYPGVRKALLQAQRDFDRPPGLVAEGRDCGTVVFPKAGLKIFLTASLDARASRRSQEENSKNLGSTQAHLEQRDKADSQRTTSPMVPASDAVEIDSSSLTPKDVVNRILEIMDKRGLLVP